MPFFLLSFFLADYKFTSDRFWNWVLNMSADLVDGAMGNEELSHIYELTVMGSSYDIFWSIVNKAFGMVEPFGYAMVTVYFLMYLFDATVKDQITVDSLIKVIIHLILVIALIKNIDTIVNTFLGMTDGLIGDIKGSLTGKNFDAFNGKNSNTGLTGAEIVEKWYSTGEDKPGTIFLQSILIMLFHKIAAVGIAFATIQRSLELGWRLILSPVGLANCFDGGMNSKGVTYLKTLITVILSSLAIFVTAAVGYALSASFLTVPEKGLFMAQLVQLGTAGACIGVSNKVRDLA